MFRHVRPKRHALCASNDLCRGVRGVAYNPIEGSADTETVWPVLVCDGYLVSIWLSFADLVLIQLEDMLGVLNLLGNGETLVVGGVHLCGHSSLATGK